jgi:hypothetical protein
MDLRRRTVIGAALGAAAMPSAAAAATTVTETTLHGRNALSLSNGRMQLSVLPGGGFIGEVRLASGNPKADINPMRVPHYPTIDPYAFTYAHDGAAYGTDVQARLMSGYMGQFTCFPQFGNQPEEFAAADYSQHGEALTVKWRRETSADADLVMSADLPRTQYGFRRAITLLPDETVAYVTETAENRMIQDRPLQWVQHVTMGPSFVEKDKMFADASVDKVMLGSGDSATLAAWPQSANEQGQPHDYRVFSGDTGKWLLQRQGHNWFVAYHADYNVLIGYVFDAAINPWLLDWQQNRTNMMKPWHGKVVARGFCWGDSLIQGAKDAVSQGKNFGVPQYSWINGLARRSQRYAIFLTEIPAGFRGVADLKAGDGEIVLTEKETNKNLRLKAAQI